MQMRDGLEKNFRGRSFRQVRLDAQMLLELHAELDAILRVCEIGVDRVHRLLDVFGGVASGCQVDDLHHV